MAKTFAQYPTLVKALTYMAMDSRLTFRAEWKRAALPTHLVAQVYKAERAAAFLDDRQVAQLQLAGIEGIAEAEDDCLETVAAGDRAVSDFILANTPFGEALDDVLCSAYDGELHGLLFDTSR